MGDRGQLRQTGRQKDATTIERWTCFLAGSKGAIGWPAEKTEALSSGHSGPHTLLNHISTNDIFALRKDELHHELEQIEKGGVSGSCQHILVMSKSNKKGYINIK